MTDAVDMFPGLGDDARGLQQDAIIGERWIDLDRKGGINREALCRISVEQGTGSGLRTIPTKRSPGIRSQPTGAVMTSARDSWPMTS
jgi:hypothetical protein